MSECSVTRSCPTLCDPMDYSPPTFLFMGLSQQEHWSGLPFPSLGYLPDHGIKPRSPALQADASPSELEGNPRMSSIEAICQFRRDGFNPWVGKILWSRKWQPTLVFLLGKSHGQKSLVTCSPWGPKVRHD